MHMQLSVENLVRRTERTTRRRALHRLSVVGPVLLAAVLSACGGSSDPGLNTPPGPPGTRQGSGQDAPSGEHQVSGYAYDSEGGPLAGVEIQIYILPRTFGSLYRTMTGADGSYSYSVPEGVYQLFAQIDDPDPNLVVDLEPLQTTSDGVASITVPPSQVVDFHVP
jgi:hypothetical protein